VNEQQAARWAATRAKGRTCFIWIYGVVLYGLAAAVSWSITMSALQGWDQIFIYLPIALVVFPIGGYFFGVWVWKKSEAEYEKTVSKQDLH